MWRTVTDRPVFTADDDGSRLRPVVYDFWLPQHAEISWQVLGLRGHEELAVPYEFELELACPDTTLAPEGLLGADCELLLDRNGLTRIVFGLVAAAEIAVGRGVRA